MYLNERLGPAPHRVGDPGRNATLRTVRYPLALALLLLVLPAAPALAQGEGGCLTQDPPPPGKVEPLRFGITPRLAGSVGAAQEEPAPENPAKTTAALRVLRPKGKQLVLRLNRLFWADGTPGIRKFGRLVRRYALAGLKS